MPAKDAEGRKKRVGHMLRAPMSLAKIRALRFQSQPKVHMSILGIPVHVTHRNDTACWTTAAIFVVLSLSVPYIARASPIAASQPIRFAPNADSVTISGGVVRGARDLYHLDARSGHRLSVTIKAPAESAVFQLYRPGYTLTSDGAITSIKGEALIGARETDDARAWTGPLPVSGRYLIVVGGVRGNASYRLSVTIK